MKNCIYCIIIGISFGIIAIPFTTSNHETIETPASPAPVIESKYFFEKREIIPYKNYKNLPRDSISIRILMERECDISKYFDPVKMETIIVGVPCNAGINGNSLYEITTKTGIEYYTLEEKYDFIDGKSKYTYSFKKSNDILRNVPLSDCEKLLDRDYSIGHPDPCK